MSRDTNQVVEQSSRFNEYVASVLTAVVLVAFSFISVASIVHI
jgi:hypothetical protein